MEASHLILRFNGNCIQHPLMSNKKYLLDSSNLRDWGSQKFSVFYIINILIMVFVLYFFLISTGNFRCKIKSVS
ncbi:hypothetical protein I7I50_04567 [Histoplasma capsulatum G186AR]|uniref:Uncharacterized protein n=1 Tax=Ajellomyces capsulatus TaxID=5037 RepID=A0A8H7YR03_AJECA|nr:hypothetical protein I7I52_05476 [Histoplasma capsulatum]QSS75435.1 hypothetical protein I7I50_04567 [Histoplasma capsulatum G186AR]